MRKLSHASIPSAANDDEPGAGFYEAAGYQPAKAKAMAGVDAMCAGFAAQNEAVAQLPAEVKREIERHYETQSTPPPKVKRRVLADWHVYKARRRAARSPRRRRPASPRTQAKPKRGERSKSSSSDDPGGEPPHPWRRRRDPWALTWAERQPLIWRLRAARCRLLEIREAFRMGVDR
jgi:hypothetical protein